MGRTIPSVSARVDGRIARWERFARHLRSGEREAFLRLMAAVRDLRGAIDAADESDLGVAMLLAMAVHMEAKGERTGGAAGAGQERLAGP